MPTESDVAVAPRTHAQYSYLTSSLKAADDAIERVGQYTRALSSLHSSVPCVVPFWVDDTAFAVSRELLLKDPQSLLFVLANEHYSLASSSSPPKDSAGAGRKRQRTASPAPATHQDQRSGVVIPNKDPRVFGMLLNMLRGYRHAVPESCQSACHDDAVFYGLERSWNARFGSTPEYQFKVSVFSTKLNSEAVCALASDYFASGTHKISLLVAQCDRVGLGVMATGVNLEDRDALRMGVGGALYWNDGKVSSNFGNLEMFETGKRFKSSSIVQVTLDADEGIVSWMLVEEEHVAALRLPAGGQFAFAVMASRTSQVNIVPFS